MFALTSQTRKRCSDSRSVVYVHATGMVPTCVRDYGRGSATLVPFEHGVDGVQLLGVPCDVQRWAL